MRYVSVLPILAVLLGSLATANGDDQAAQPAAATLERAALRGLELVQAAAARYPANRQCFSCHHQTLPMLAIVAARQAGQGVDESVFQGQAQFTLASFHGRLESLRQGQGIGGRSMTVAYGLWTLDLAGHPADETTEAMATFLLKNQKQNGSWSPPSNRPPLEESNLMCTTLAVYGLEKYASEAQRADAERAIGKARTWIVAQSPVSHEDRVSRLWALYLLGEDRERIAAAREVVLMSQRDDGGWSQLDRMTSDAYATGQTLHVLHVTGLPRSHPSFRRGLKFLLETQREDGSWLVETRSKPVQVYFDNGDPHGKHQFISTAASSWAVAALLLGTGDKQGGK